MRNLSKNTDLSCRSILEESIYTKSKKVLNMLKLYLLRDKARIRFCLFVIMLYVPSNDFQTRTKQRIQCVAQGLSAVPPVNLVIWPW